MSRRPAGLAQPFLCRSAPAAVQESAAAVPACDDRGLGVTVEQTA